jgi:hypothetical protein
MFHQVINDKGRGKERGRGKGKDKDVIFVSINNLNNFLVSGLRFPVSHLHIIKLMKIIF